MEYKHQHRHKHSTHPEGPQESGTQKQPWEPADASALWPKSRHRGRVDWKEGDAQMQVAEARNLEEAKKLHVEALTPEQVREKIIISLGKTEDAVDLGLEAATTQLLKEKIDELSPGGMVTVSKGVLDLIGRIGFEMIGEVVEMPLALAFESGNIVGEGLEANDKKRESKQYVYRVTDFRNQLRWNAKDSIDRLMERAKLISDERALRLASIVDEKSLVSVDEIAVLAYTYVKEDWRKAAHVRDIISDLKDTPEHLEEIHRDVARSEKRPAKRKP